MLESTSKIVPLRTSVLMSATLVLGSHAVDANVLLSEIVVTPTGGEFIEIHNPTAAAVDLSDVYLTDATFSSGGTFYYNIVTGANAGGGGFADFHARFPNGASIAPGEYQTVALNGSANFNTAYGFDPTYELYEDGASADAVPDMREALPGLINNQGGLTNSGEVAILYTWDGVSDLVADLDYVVWGDKAEGVDKTGISMDGPDADAVATAYLNDTTITAQAVVAAGAHATGASWQRGDLNEGAETQAGGNGVSGNDETSEDLDNTWCEIIPPTPGAASGTCPGVVPGTTLIHVVQGSGAASPLDGNTVTIEGIVVGDFQDGAAGTSGDLDGFFVQEEDADADGDPTTSEGIFVFDGGGPAVDVAIGDQVQVTGTVTEFLGLTELTTVAVTVVSSGSTLPTAAAVNLPFAAADFPERFEGMRVTFPQDLIVTDNFNLGRFGELELASGGRLPQPTGVAAPGAAALALQAANDLNRILLDDGLAVQNPDPAPYGLSAASTIRGGDTVTVTSGVLSYAFDEYRVQPIDVAVTSTNPRPPMPASTGGSLTVAGFNVFNYFATLDGSGDVCGPSANQTCRGADSASELDRQRDKIVDAIVKISPAIAGLVEIENTGNAGIQHLVDSLNAVAGPGTYAFIDTGNIGDDAIRVALIYRPATVTPVGTHSVLDNSVDPTFNDGWNRPALAQTFEQNSNGERLTIAVNHFKSKGSACDALGDPDTGDGQGNCNLTRTGAANALVNWLVTDPTGSGDPDYLIIGDLNSYAQEDPVTAIKAAGYTDLIDAFIGAGAYSYSIFGQWGYIDHALGSGSLAPHVTGVAYWHINADEPTALDYNEEFKSASQLGSLYNADPFRSSDHDPLLIGLDLVDQDGDGVADSTEDAGPNGGDGNNDGTPDREQAHVATLPTATGAGHMTLVVSGGCSSVLAVSAVHPGSLPVDNVFISYPLGLLAFELPCENGLVGVIFHGTTGFPGMTFRKYGPVTPGDPASTAWYDFSAYASASGNTWTLDLADDRLGDDTGDDGRIVGLGGPAQLATSIPTLSEWGLLFLIIMLAAAGYYARTRRQT